MRATEEKQEMNHRSLPVAARMDAARDDNQRLNEAEREEIREYAEEHPGLTAGEVFFRFMRRCVRCDGPGRPGWSVDRSCATRNNSHPSLAVGARKESRLGFEPGRIIESICADVQCGLRISYEDVAEIAGR
jgi:hypothetical protein